MFTERYVNSINASDLRDDDHHHATDALVAAALADQTGSDLLLGSLLCRVKYADGTVRKLFEAGTANLAHLIRIWHAAVTQKGKDRAWVVIRTERDIIVAHALYRRVAEASLAHWLDGRCEPCEGAGQMPDRRLCTCCAGSGRAQVEAGRFETQKILDMVSELEGIYQSHGGRAKAFLRRVP